MGLKQQVFDPHKTMLHLDENEHIICDVRRHPFGLIILYVSAFVAILFFAVVGVFYLPTLDAISGNSYTLLIGGLIFVLFMLCLALWVATAVYRESRLIVTNKDITQVLQFGLFNRKMSQLSLANVEDVTSDQNGIFPTYFNYGTLKIETAGEQSNFQFIYCPNPGATATAILEARERFLESHGEMPHSQSALYQERKRKLRKIASEVAEEILPPVEKIT